MEEIKQGIYRHFKGKFVLVMCEAKHSDDGSKLVIYKGLNDGGFFARPHESFVQMVENKDGILVPRFTPAVESDIAELLKQNLIDENTLEDLKQMQ